ncbi:P-loop containing nucleoside triphosphate hydrolase protein, partial [Mycena leptocephala]
FHGRESELHDITVLLSQDSSARIAILGPGGIGKTSLAKAVLHHPAVTAKYQNCFFISCESAHTRSDLITLLGSHLNLRPDKNLFEQVLNFFARGPPCLLILDNFETPWEPIDSRNDTEELLSRLMDFEHLALILTMRGAERPAKVRWTRPFLLPLLPLTNDAAREIFGEITDDVYDDSVVEQLLALTDNLPLAIDLIAHLADFEGCNMILSRWDTEKTLLLSEGSDRKSNLNISITLSLSSPRMTSQPGAKDLLSLLSLLPDGLSESELLQSSLPIPNILSCKAALLRTCLAYIDHDKRLKVLVPIREYLKQTSPASPVLVRPLSNYFHELLSLYKNYQGMQTNATIIARITANLGNIVNILIQELHPDNPDVRDAVYCVFSFNAFIRQAGHHHSLLIDHVSHVVSELGDHKLQALFIVEMFNSAYTLNIPDPGNLINQAVNHFKQIDEPVAECKFITGITISILIKFFSKILQRSWGVLSTSPKRPSFSYQVL